jgi:hypothetical protein
MSEQKRPSVPQPSEVPSDVPEAEQHRRVLPAGQIPGLPISSDPLLQPLPRPAPLEVPPLD